LLVRGQDQFNHYLADIPASEDLNPDAFENFRMLNRIHREIQANPRTTKILFGIIYAVR